MGAVVTETLRILNEAAAYLLLGFLLAGVLHGVVSRSPGFVRALRARGSRSVWLAALIGLPLPLCSCSVLPVGLALRKKGASKGATVAFLISAPETDIVSILVTYGLLGPVMAVFRPVAALVTALAAGLAADWADRSTQTPEAPGVSGLELAPDSCADYHGERGALWNILHYGFVQFFDDIIGSLVFGIVLGGAITALLPALGVERFGERTFLSMLAMLALGIPMYVCASASVPIAAGLIAGGLSPRCGTGVPAGRAGHQHRQPPRAVPAPGADRVHRVSHLHCRGERAHGLGAQRAHRVGHPAGRCAAPPSSPSASSRSAARWCSAC